MKNAIDVNQYVISREEHADGTPHVHAYIRTTRKLSTTNQRVFDVLGHHPNIQAARNIKAVVEYVKKDGSFISNLTTSTDTGSKSLKRSWGELLKEATNGQNFLNSVKEEYPREYCLYLDRLKAVANHEWPEVQLPYTNPFTTWNIPTELEEWATANITTNNEVGK